MESGSVALSRNESRQAVLLQLLHSERQLQDQLREQGSLLEQLNDAAVQLHALWTMKAAQEEETEGNGSSANAADRSGSGVGCRFAKFYSLHELLTLLASVAQQQTDAAKGQRGDRQLQARREKLGRLVDMRVMDTRGPGPSHDIVFGSLHVGTQLLLVPHLQAWLRRLADALPGSCQHHTLSQHSGQPCRARDARLEEEEEESAATSPPFAGEEAHSGAQHPRGGDDENVNGDQKAVEREEEVDDGLPPDTGETSLASLSGEWVAKRRRIGEVLPPAAQLLLSPALCIATPGLRLRLLLDALWRLLTFLQLLLGLTATDVGSILRTSDRDSATSRVAPQGLAAFTALMARWLDAMRAGRLSPAQQQRLPLVCLAQQHAWVRGALRFILVDVQEVTDTLGEELRFQSRHGATRSCATMAMAGSWSALLPDALASLCSPPAETSEGTRDGADEWPSVAKLAGLTATALAVGATLRECIRLTEP